MVCAVLECVRKVIDDPEFSVYVLAVVAGFTWRNGVNDKHVVPLFEDLVKLQGLPSPIVFLSLDYPNNYLLPIIAGIERAQLVESEDAGVTRH